MPPSLALVLWILLTVMLFREDRRTFQRIPAGVWLPLIYCFILASRLPSQWLAESFGVSRGGYEDGSPLDRMVYTSLLLASSWILWRRPSGFRSLFRGNWPLTLYLVYTLASVTWSDFPLISLKRWVRDLGVYFTIGVVVTDADVESTVRLFFRRLAYLLLPLSTVLIKYFPQLSRGFDIWSGQAYNFGISTSKNGLGALSLICGLSLVWDCLADHRTSGRSPRVVFVNLVLLANALWLLMLSRSATSLFCFVIGSILITLMCLKPRFVSPRVISWSFMVSLIAYAPADYFLDITEAAVRGAGRNMTFTGRTDVWAEVIKIFESPIFGAGYESFWLGERLAHMWTVFTWGINQAHNGYLEVYVNLGIVGLFVVFILLCFFYFRITCSLTTEHSSSRLAMPLFATFILYNLTEAAIRPCLPWYVLLLTVLPHSPTIVRRTGVGAQGSQPTAIRSAATAPIGRSVLEAPRPAVLRRLCFCSAGGALAIWPWPTALVLKWF